MDDRLTEREQARLIAERWLDFKMNALTQMVPGDPDCDACVLARQYVRALERLESLRAAMQPFASVAEAIQATDYFRTDDPRKPLPDTPVSYLVQRLGDPITIAAVFAVQAALAGSA